MSRSRGRTGREAAPRLRREQLANGPHTGSSPVVVVAPLPSFRSPVLLSLAFPSSPSVALVSLLSPVPTEVSVSGLWRCHTRHILPWGRARAWRAKARDETETRRPARGTQDRESTKRKGRRATARRRDQDNACTDAHHPWLGRFSQCSVGSSWAVGARIRVRVNL